MPNATHAAAGSIAGAGAGAGTGAGTGAATSVRSATARPKTAYHTVTWKENLDAFNKRLRRGSLSLDATAQEEELASQAMARVKAQQYNQQPDQSSSQDYITLTYGRLPVVDASGNAIDGADEQTSLLHGLNGKPVKLNHDQTMQGAIHHDKTYGSMDAQSTGYPHQDEPFHHVQSYQYQYPQQEQQQQQQQQPPQQNATSQYEPAFPTQLNPVLATTKSSKLGTFSGVFIPCVLSIWGIILFLRFGFIIGQAGVMGTLGMFIIGYAINILTTFSLSAVSSNGTVRGGGPYYLISRSLGPEFGGSIGLIFFSGTVLGCGMNVLGFVEPLIANFGESSGTVYRVLPQGPLWEFIYGTILLVLCTLVCLVGSK
ncbi:hypothetical protein BGZ94_005708, partial [Podila epigama]